MKFVSLKISIQNFNMLNSYTNWFVFFNFIQEKALIEAFEAPAEHPGCSGSRGLQDNLSDLKAQIAANQVGTISEF
jgi:hypothetical protein